MCAPNAITYGEQSRRLWKFIAPPEVATMKEFPPRQKVASFNLDEVMQEMTQSGAK